MRLQDLQQVSGTPRIVDLVVKRVEPTSPRHPSVMFPRLRSTHSKSRILCSRARIREAVQARVTSPLRLVARVQVAQQRPLELPIWVWAVELRQVVALGSHQ